MPKTKLNPHPWDCMLLNIKVAMTVRGVTVSDLARRLNVKPDTVYKWLRGDNIMGTDTLFRIAAILRVTPAVLVAPTGEPAENCMRLIC